MTPTERLLADRWEVIDGTETGLWPELAADAALARFEGGDRGQAGMIRLTELVVSPGGVAQGGPLIDALRRADATVLLTELASLWWTQTLLQYPASDRAADVLAALCRCTGELGRWLRAWLDALDGPGAQHLAEAVCSDFQSSLWPSDDLRGQAEAWARSEAVVNGITLIGGVHLEPGQLDELLDRII